jgi:hypothetical protein
MNEIVENVFLVVSVILLVAMIVCIYLGWFTEELSDEEIELREDVEWRWYIYDTLNLKGTDKLIICRIKYEGMVMALFEDEYIETLEALNIEKIEYNVTRKNYKQKIKGFLRA